MPTSSRWCAASCSRCSASPPNRWTCGSRGGAAGCRNTPSGTSNASRGFGPRSPASPGWRLAARRTTGSASRRASRAQSGRWSRRCAREDNGCVVKAAEAQRLNDAIRYTAWSVFRASRPLGDADRPALANEVDELFEQLAAKDVTVRGSYDVSALRADADLMVWWHSSTADALQDAYSRLRRTRLGAHLEPTWSNMALHRPAEFNKSHIPAFLAEEEARAYVCVYPFVRSYEWYLLPETERRRLLAEHGQLAREYPDVRANTVASFALGDYEWMLAFEADELHRIVDLMRHLRAPETRRHVRLEVPFYTGTRHSVAEIVASLP